MIPPKLFSSLITKYNECILSEDKLKVDGGSYAYVTMLSDPDSKGESNGEVPDVVSEEKPKKPSKSKT